MVRRVVVRALLAAVLAELVAGLAAVAVLTRDDPAQVTLRVVGGNRPVDPAGVDPLVVTAQNSPTLVADPTRPDHLVVVNRVDIPTFGCELRMSSDAGATWQETRIPAEGPCFGPDAAFDAAGRLHVLFTTLSPVPPGTSNPGALWVASSDDGGRSLGAPVRVSGPLAFQARMASDRKRPGRLYVTWVQAAETASFGFATTGNPVVVSRSDNGGATWSSPTRVSAPHRSRVVAPVPATSGDGTLHVVLLDLGDDRLNYDGAHEGRGGEPDPGPWALVSARSTDDGTTWAEAVINAGVVPARRFLALLAPTPTIAVDGRVVTVAFTDARRGDPDVWLWRSSDGGRQWSGPTRVNDTPPGDGRTQELPALSVAPNGRLDVAYYDRRADATDTMTEVSMQSSNDGGRTFRPAVTLSDRPFDSRLGLGADRGMPELGSRLAVLSTDAGALAVWSDTRNGSPAIAKQLLALSVVSAQ